MTSKHYLIGAVLLIGGYALGRYLQSQSTTPTTFTLI